VPNLNHHSLVAWQRADDLYIRLNKLIDSSFPRNEQYALSIQLRRAAFSVPANIVEGFARVHTAERVQFLRIAAASLAEVGYCLHAAKRLGYIDEATYGKLELEVRQVSAPLGGLLKHVRRWKHPDL
jgi:four helix bundle protein